MSCSHYERGCHLLADCCGEWFPCRLCHDDESDHAMNRHAVKRVRCRKCRCEQQPQKTCEKCKHVLGQYFCSVCNLFDHKGGDKAIFHCDQCGICRVGGRDNFFHCGTCVGCYPISGQSTHKCVSEAMLKECCICLEDMFNSRESPSILRCGHILHMACFKSMAKFARTRFECPLCRGSLLSSDDEVAAHDDERGMDGGSNHADQVDEDGSEGGDDEFDDDSSYELLGDSPMDDEGDDEQIVGDDRTL
ncbi:hypothetical protein H257_10380 [Aphanomyces astaci]|uniref:RING-type domain-containing protein n=1 Tax=Aphanomyces astaci TaxID=112090 RepID=W4G7A7_APHAT|nr:hypothetical protein H257_10380 [Aphanomyces astaci]ETV75161.1 hypothetical protein H257_10380 [Aphanomyces astaci]|eukprot:XP_009835210.1 hypothetical protein H257_10380 [Aphanomyces astaci]